MRFVSSAQVLALIIRICSGWLHSLTRGSIHDCRTIEIKAGLTLYGINTLNGVTKVSAIVVAASIITQPQKTIPQPVATSQPPQQNNESGDLIARYAEDLASQIEKMPNPACRMLANTIRSFGNSTIPAAIRQRQIDTLFAKIPMQSYARWNLK